MKDPKEFYNLRVSFLTRVLTTEAGLAQSDFEFHNPATVRNPRKNEMDKLGYAYIGFIGKNKASNDSKANVYLTSIKVRSYKSNEKKGFAQSCLYVDLTTISEEAINANEQTKLSSGNNKAAKTKAMPEVIAKGLRKLLKDGGFYINTLPTKVSKVSTSCVFVDVKANRMYMINGTEATKKSLYSSVLSFLKSKKVLIDGNGTSITLLDDSISPLITIGEEIISLGKKPKAKAKATPKAKAKSAPKAKAKAAPKAKTKPEPKVKESGVKINLLIQISDVQAMQVIKNVDIDIIKKARPELFKVDSCNQVLDHIEDNFVLIPKDSAIVKELRSDKVKTVKQIKRELSKATP